MIHFFVSLPITLILLFSAVSVHTPNADKVGEIRYEFMLRDTAGDNFQAIIYANDEKETEETDNWSGAVKGDMWFTGSYQIALRKERETNFRTPVPIPFQEPISFNKSRKMVYKVGSPEENQPDLLVVTQHGGSNGNFAVIFVINNGQIVPLRFLSNVKNYEIFISDHVSCIGHGQYEFRHYDNTVGKWITETWRLDQKKAIFTLIERKSE